MTIERNFFEQDRKRFIEDLIDVNSMVGFNSASLDSESFVRKTDIAFELANFGTMNKFGSFDFSDLCHFAESIGPVLETVGRNPNIESTYPHLELALNCLSLYLHLYIAEDGFEDYCNVTIDAIASSLGMKVSSLKNMVSLKKLKAMSRAELKEFLEAQPQFKVYKPYNSVLLDAPLDFSGVRNPDDFMVGLEMRTKKYGMSSKLEELLELGGLSDKSISRFGQFVCLTGERSRASSRLSALLASLNFVPGSVEQAVLNCWKSLGDNQRYTLQINYETVESEVAKPNPYARPDIIFSADNLGEMLKTEFGFTSHQLDRGKNKKIFAIEKGELTLAVERTKAPNVWVEAKYVDGLPDGKFYITWYEPSEDGTGRHSGLKLYEKLHTTATAKVKLTSFDQARNLMKHLENKDIS